jgi:ABC-2 type transport system ATP-binding protein
VRSLDLDVLDGEIFGFLGLNGAGKTTSIRILLDLLRPSGGKASIFGQDCQSRGLQARSQTGYLPGEMAVYSHLTGREVLEFLSRLGGQTVSREYRRQIQERLELPDKDLGRKLREYSTGMKRKLGLIQALQADPRLLILDEPTEGLDPVMQESFYRLLADLRSRGRTIFMSSHVLSEVERVCDRIAVLRKGELVLLAPVDEIRRLAPRLVRVSFSEAVARRNDLPHAYSVVEMADRHWDLSVKGPLGPLVKMLAELPVEDLEVKETRLEDVLIKYYQEGVQ